MQQFARDLAAFLRQHRGQGRVAVHLHALLDHLAAELHVALRRADAARDVGAVLLQPGLRRSLPLAGSRRGVGERQQHLHQRDAVGIAVVDARDQRRTAVVALDQVELPQRPAGIQRRGGELADEALQCALAARPGNAVSCTCQSRSKSSSVCQNAPAARVDGLLAEARGSQETLLDHAPQRSSDIGSANISTPVIIIGLVGRSMRSQAVSTLAIGSRRVPHGLRFARFA